ncbi:translationally-controlled tumor protein homolog isoform X1 [Pomacea canaliculata]|uniref:translationally-controlled tumor protein homolog isoform X1 n=1 Tax=Pomacea canaliculata TaxID=400727 RepID=UPI000D735E14|nr:translationally-controlled tumor protein homolog isoform X1 [Pomacea canaliculata]
MIIYKDIITGDELFGETCNPKLIENAPFYVMEAKMIKQKQGVDNVNIGANPSAEEADEGVDEAAVEEGLDIVLINRLKETAFGSKKDFMNYWKAHFAWYTSSRLKEKLQEVKPERADVFKTECKAMVEKWVGSWKDLSFFFGESNNPEAALIVFEWNDDGVSGKAYVLKDAVISEKY